MGQYGTTVRHDCKLVWCVNLADFPACLSSTLPPSLVLLCLPPLHFPCTHGLSSRPCSCSCRTLAVKFMEAAVLAQTDTHMVSLWVMQGVLTLSRFLGQTALLNRCTHPHMMHTHTQTHTPHTNARHMTHARPCPCVQLHDCHTVISPAFLLFPLPSFQTYTPSFMCRPFERSAQSLLRACSHWHRLGARGTACTACLSATLSVLCGWILCSCDND